MMDRDGGWALADELSVGRRGNRGEFHCCVKGEKILEWEIIKLILIMMIVI